ncbi:hypothetical protein [Nostoc sp.]
MMSPRGCAFAPASSIAKQTIAAYSPFKVVRTTAEAISALLVNASFAQGG